MSVGLTGIQSRDIAEIWPHVEGMIEDGLRSRGVEPKLDPIYDELRKGIRQLWLATSQERGLEAVLLTRIQKDHRGRYCALKLVVGEDPERWLHLLQTVEKWAAERGCFMVTTEWTRTGWEKLLPGYRPMRVWLEKELDNE